MGIFDRLGDVIKSYINDEDERIFGKSRERYGSPGDPDLNAAFEELNEFLGGGRERNRGGGGNGDWGERGKNSRDWAEEPGNPGPKPRRDIPGTLKADFAELGLTPEASAEDCKAAYKRLLKLHHPDRHAGHAGNMKKATEKSARINAAYDRIMSFLQN